MTPRVLFLQQRVGDPQIFSRGELAIARSTFDQRDLEAEPLGNAGIVGEVAARLPRRCTMSREDRVELESLRRLRLPQTVALDRAGHAALLGALYAVGDGQGGEGALMGTETVDDAVDQFGRDEGPCRIVDENGGGRRTCERLETCADRVLTSRTSCDGLPQAPRKGLACCLVERLVIGMDDHEDVVDARMRGEGGDGPGDHRHPADRAVLLGGASPPAARAPLPAATISAATLTNRPSRRTRMLRTSRNCCTAAKQFLRARKLPNILPN